MALSALSREASASTASASSADDAGALPRRSSRRDADDADAPRLPLRRRQTTQPEARGARAWLAAAGDHPVLAAVGAVLTVMLPTRVASTLHSYASHYNLVEDAPRPPLTRSSGTPGEDFGFFVAITPLSRAGGDAPFAGDRAFKSFAGGTPPLVGYKPNPLIARKPPGIPELPPPPPSS